MCLLLLVCRSSRSILDTYLLLEVCSTNLTLVFAFLLPLKMSFSEEKILMKLKIIHLFFHYVLFMSCLKSLCLSHEDILLQKPYFEIPVGYLVDPAPTTEVITLHLWPSKGTFVINHLLSVFDPLFCFTDLSLIWKTVLTSSWWYLYFQYSLIKQLYNEPKYYEFSNVYRSYYSVLLL